MLCALQMKYHPSLHANLSVVTGVPSCIREVLLCALGLLFNFFMQLFGGKSDAVCIADEVSSMFSSKLSIACLQLRHYHLRSFTVCVWWTVCPLASLMFLTVFDGCPVWTIFCLLWIASCVDDLFCAVHLLFGHWCDDVNVGNTGRKIKVKCNHFSGSLTSHQPYSTIL